jgi:hypothetical protein
MQTVDVRILLPDDVDVERFVERLGMAARHYEVLGATQLVPDESWFSKLDNGCSVELVSSTVYKRPGIDWDGSE